MQLLEVTAWEPECLIKQNEDQNVERVQVMPQRKIGGSSMENEIVVSLDSSQHLTLCIKHFA